MCRATSQSIYLIRRTPIGNIIEETPDISEYLYFDFYYRVWFKQDSGIGKTRLGSWLGVAESTVFLMRYLVLPDTGFPEARTTVQPVTET